MSAVGVIFSNIHDENVPELSRQSLAYIARHHDYLKVAQQYVDLWQGRKSQVLR